jgi:hypothetical protein
MSKLKDLSYDIETLFIDGKSPREIAEELGCPLGIVKGALEGFGVDVRDMEPDLGDYYGA